MRQRIALLVNPTSGKGSGRRVGELTAAQLVAAGHEVTNVSAPTSAQARLAASDVVSAGVDTLVVVGGDGTVHLGVNVCAGTPTRLAVVAAGTGNDIARDLGLPVRDPAAAVRVIDDGHSRVIDAGRARPSGIVSELVGDTGHDESARVEARWFAGVLGAGFDAVVNARAQRMRWPRGQLRYTLAIVRELPVFSPIPYAVELDGVRVETRAMLVAVANTRSFGGGMRVCPDAEPDDGRFDVLIVHALSLGAFVRVFPKVYAGTHVSHPQVEIRRARHVRLEAHGIAAQADGEPVGVLPLDVEIVPGALRVVVPAEAGRR